MGHAASIESRICGVAPRMQGAVRADRTELRPLGDAPLVRAGPALAPLPRLADRGGPAATPCSTSRPGRLQSRSSSCARRTATSSGSTRRPEMLEEGRRRVTLAAAAEKVRLVEATHGALPFEDGCFDAADVHLPAPLRRRPAGDAPRACPRGEAGRDRRRARVRRSARACGGRSGKRGCARGFRPQAG